MQANTLILSAFILAGTLANAAQADSLRLGQRHSFQTEVTRTAGARTTYDMVHLAGSPRAQICTRAPAPKPPTLSAAATRIWLQRIRVAIRLRARY